MATRKRLPFDLPPRSIYQLDIPLADFASMREGEPIEQEAAELLEKAWLDNIYKLDNDNEFTIGILHRWGLSASEQRQMEDVSKYVRQLTEQFYELVDKVCAATEKPVEEVQAAMDGLERSKYVPVWLRPYMDEVLAIRDPSPTYQIRLSALHLKRTITEWTDQHSECLRSGIMDGLIRFAMLESGIKDEEPPKSKPESGSEEKSTD